MHDPAVLFGNFGFHDIYIAVSFIENVWAPDQPPFEDGFDERIS
jgi:hypothetical protein